MVANLSEDRLDILADQISPADLKRLAEAEKSSPTILRAPAPTRTFEPAPPSTPAVSLDSKWTTDDDETGLRAMLLDDTAEEHDRTGRTVRWWDIPGLIQLLVLSLAMMVERVYRRGSEAKARFDALPPLLRGAYLITLSIIIMLGAGYFVGTFAYDYIMSQRGPFLAEALVAPFELAERPVPVEGATAASALPSAIGDYVRTDRAITQLQPSSPTNHCLLGIGYSREETNPPLCRRSYGMLSIAAAQYRYQNRFVDVAIAQFPSEEHAAVTMEELLAHARRWGQVGNFALGGVGGVDYFYSSVRGWMSFTWARGPWVFSISSNRVSTVEEVIPLFPY